jgi:hypothetical protein
MLGMLLAFALSLGLASAVAQTSSVTGAALEDMKLLSSGSGWALAGDRLFWTSDNGQNWNDITPGSGQQSVSEAFFLNPQTGWAILSGSDSEATSLTVASTQNGGKSWQNASVALDSIIQGRQFAGVASVYFIDAQQGWLILRLGSSSNFSVGAALHTADGGLTWTALPSPPAAGSIVFVTSRSGWMAGGPAGSQLWFTHDGGQTWQPETIAAPDGCSGSQTAYSLPVFTGATNGRLTETTTNPDGNCVIDYGTANGGQSWQMERIGKNSAVPSVVVASTGTQARHIYASGADISIEENGVLHQAALPAGLQPNGSITRAGFISDSVGWITYSSGACSAAKTHCSQQSELLTTMDGGKTFTVITPHIASQTPSGASMPLSRNSRAAMLSAGAASPETASGANTTISQSSGIDLACAPSASNMQTWWTDSPYQDVGVYLGGCDVYCVSPNGQNTCASNWTAGTSKTVDTNLTPAWISSVEKMGWGILPLWVGPQAPCIADASSYWTIDNSDTYSTGAYQADQAVAQANAQGITNGIIYYDMEGYTPDGGSCSAAVESFLIQWTTELHAQGFASGLYGGMSAFQTDFLALSPEPDDIWVALWNANNTVWNLGTLSNSDWPNNQRIHQWSSLSSGETWGGVNLGGMDKNVVDASVVGSWLPTSPSFALSNSAAITISTLGNSGTSTISVTPSNGFTGTVNLSCSIAPAATVNPTCSVPSSITISGTAPSPATLTIATTAGTMARNSLRRNFFLAAGGPVWACLLLCGISRRRKSWQRLLGVVLLTVSIGTTVACGGGGASTGSGGGTGGGAGGTNTGTYTVTVLGIDQATGTVKSNTTVTLTVN